MLLLLQSSQKLHRSHDDDDDATKGLAAGRATGGGEKGIVGTAAEGEQQGGPARPGRVTSQSLSPPTPDPGTSGQKGSTEEAHPPPHHGYS